MTPVIDANAEGAFGLYAASDFRIVTGECGDCVTIPQALWYFRDEWIAAPLPEFPVASFAQAATAFDDVRAWARSHATRPPIDYPPLVWVAAPHIVHGARLSADGERFVAGGATLQMRTVPRIPLNRSYYDASSVRFLSVRSLTLRGTRNGDEFVVRSLWPDDFTLGPSAPPANALPDAPSPQLAIRALMRQAPRGGAQSEFMAQTIWQRNGTGGDWRGKAVLGFLVNGAQGDDDEAHGGHAALVTGRIRDDGRIGDWLVDNFYSLDVESEKGIIAAPLPLDNYLGDLNSGQAWYRPSCMLVLVLRDARAAHFVQSAINRVYNQFYRHQLVYYHPSDNCASISVDALRALGWPVPARGPSNRLLAWIGFPFVTLKERSLRKAKIAFDYLYTDQTRLLPAVALEEAFASVLSLVHGNVREDDGELARMLAADAEAIAFMRIPQLPSSRVPGDTPAVSLREYRARVPDDPALVQIVPVPPRPFPDRLRDADLLPPASRPSDHAAMMWGVASAAAIAMLLYRLWRGRRRR